MALATLAAWDLRRAAAYAEGDPAALRALYLPGSRTGARDLAVLRRWSRRGLRVTGMRTQVLSGLVLRRGRDRVVVRVTERLVGATAVGTAVRLRLPRDRPSRRTVTLVRRAGEWLVREAR
ncbi:hypothetical protein IE331_09555 [Nocardioides sp. MJB4]|uniref:Uncharacterized protein n=1 Tax=Nocardioides donggukensis TaxID=2774019 RepID=A0A927K465_9ACTN|nr:hypothetical protein [Nocardioides donggukensis]